MCRSSQVYAYFPPASGLGCGPHPCQCQQGVLRWRWLWWVELVHRCHKQWVVSWCIDVTNNVYAFFPFLGFCWILFVQNLLHVSPAAHHLPSTISNVKSYAWRPLLAVLKLCSIPLYAAPSGSELYLKCCQSLCTIPICLTYIFRYSAAPVGPVVVADQPSMAAEDFSFYGQQVPSVYTFLGIGKNSRARLKRYITTIMVFAFLRSWYPDKVVKRLEL